MAYFPFSGWKNSFFGDLHAQGRDGVDFYTTRKLLWNAGPKSISESFNWSLAVSGSPLASSTAHSFVHLSTGCSRSAAAK